MNASGCGVTVKEYAHALAHDPAYAAKAQRIAALTRDLGELLPDLVPALQARLDRLRRWRRSRIRSGRAGRRAPDRHPARLPSAVHAAARPASCAARSRPACARSASRSSSRATESHLCCGSAGTYSVLQPELAYALRDRKLASLAELQPQAIVSANVGCIQHLQTGTTTPVRHWVEVLDEALG